MSIIFHIDAMLLETERKAEWLGNDNRKIMLKIKTIGQTLPFKSGTALPSPAQAPGSAIDLPFLFLISGNRGCFSFYKAAKVRIKFQCMID